MHTTENIVEQTQNHQHKWGFFRTRKPISTPVKIAQHQTITEGYNPIIINLSSCEFTDEQLELLNLGLKFTPTPRENSDEMKSDIKEFTRKLRLGEFFLDNDTDDNSIVKNKSNFMPPRGRNRVLDNYIDHLTQTSERKSANNNSKTNLTRKQQKALSEIQQMDNIIIKEADKGGAIVIMDKDYYEIKLLDMLSDTETYKEIPKNIDKDIRKKIQTLTRSHTTNLTAKETDFLVNFEIKNSNLYGLPKIHKSQEILEAVSRQQNSYVKALRPSDLKFRPIVAGPSCATNRLSHMIDILLKPYLQHTKSYIRDDMDFLNQIPSEIKDSEQFITFDICNLYSNISEELGLQAIEYWLTKYPETLPSRFSKEFVIDSIKLILQNNTFCFADKNYIQIHGTAMGTKMAPTYANLTLAYLEEQFYNKLQTNQGKNISDIFQQSWKRYIDDCFIIWDDKLSDIRNLHQELNSIHPRLKFTMEHSKLEISFLDILLKREEKYIITDIFNKTTDTKQYLHFKSCHPRSTKDNIPYNLARRICTIISKPSLRMQRLEEMKTNLTKRGYPEKLIQRGIEKATKIPLEILRTTNRKEENNACALITTYNPNNINMWNTIQTTIGTLETDPRCKRLMDSMEMINSRRQAPNLKKILTKAKFSSGHTEVTQCSDRRCGTCSLIITGQSFIFKNSRKPFKVNFNMNCGTENLLYVLQCQGCLENYIGQTSGTLRARMRVHKQQINTPEYRQIAVSKHIAECAKNKDPPFKVFPFYKILNDDKSFRDIKEQSFIKIFNPHLNGLPLT